MTAWDDSLTAYDRDSDLTRQVDWGVDAPPVRKPGHGAMQRFRAFVRTHPRAALALAAGAVALAVAVLYLALRRRRSA